MKKMLFFLVCSCIMTNVNAQSINFLRDTTYLSQSLNAGTYVSMQNRFTNEGVLEMWYKWKMVSLVSPVGWTFTICDCNACAPEGTDTASFNVAAGANCILVYDMVHHGIEGLGIGEVKVTNLADSTDNTTIYFVGTIFSTGIYDQMKEVSINVFPNPAQSTIQYNTESIISKGSYTIIDMIGKTVCSKEIINSSQGSIDISTLEAGSYMLLLKDEKNKTMITKTIMKN